MNSKIRESLRKWEREERWTALRDRVNEYHKALQEKPDDLKIDIMSTVGGVLNAYREGDLSFDEACPKLVMAEPWAGESTPVKVKKFYGLVEKSIWIVREPVAHQGLLDGNYQSSPAPSLYRIIDQDGKIIAAQIPDKKTAEYIVRLHTLEGAMIELVDKLIEQQEALEELVVIPPLTSDVTQDEVEKILR